MQNAAKFGVRKKFLNFRNSLSGARHRWRDRCGGVAIPNSHKARLVVTAKNFFRSGAGCAWQAKPAPLTQSCHDPGETEMIVQLSTFFRKAPQLAFVAALTFAAGASTDASAQWPNTRIVSPGASGYQNFGNGVHRNPWNGSTYVQGIGAVKPSGVYQHVQGGYHVNRNTGNIYNPSTGSYTEGKQLSFRPNNYNNFGVVRHNSTTGSLHIPGAAVIKPSGVYSPMGNGYYRNQSTGNVYNPTTGAYKSRW